MAEQQAIYSVDKTHAESDLEVEFLDAFGDLFTMLGEGKPDFDSRTMFKIGTALIQNAETMKAAFYKMSDRVSKT